MDQRQSSQQVSMSTEDVKQFLHQCAITPYTLALCAVQFVCSNSGQKQLLTSGNQFQPRLTKRDTFSNWRWLHHHLDRDHHTSTNATSSWTLMLPSMRTLQELRRSKLKSGNFHLTNKNSILLASRNSVNSPVVNRVGTTTDFGNVLKLLLSSGTTTQQGYSSGSQGKSGDQAWTTLGQCNNSEITNEQFLLLLAFLNAVGRKIHGQTRSTQAISYGRSANQIVDCSQIDDQEILNVLRAIYLLLQVNHTIELFKSQLQAITQLICVAVTVRFLLIEAILKQFRASLQKDDDSVKQSENREKTSVSEAAFSSVPNNNNNSVISLSMAMNGEGRLGFGQGAADGEDMGDFLMFDGLNGDLGDFVLGGDEADMEEDELVDFADEEEDDEFERRMNQGMYDEYYDDEASYYARVPTGCSPLPPANIEDAGLLGQDHAHDLAGMIVILL